MKNNTTRTSFKEGDFILLETILLASNGACEGSLTILKVVTTDDLLCTMQTAHVLDEEFVLQSYPNQKTWETRDTTYKVRIATSMELLFELMSKNPAACAQTLERINPGMGIILLNSLKRKTSPLLDIEFPEFPYSNENEKPFITC